MPGLADMLADGMPAKLNRGEWSPELESNFNRDMQFAPGWRDWRREFIEREGVAPNTDPGGISSYHRTKLFPGERKYFKDIDWERAVKALILGYFFKMVIADNLKDYTYWIEFPHFLQENEEL